MPRIFISYRRADTEVITGRINDHLVREFGAQNIFKDVDDILPGQDFRQVLHDEISKCNIVLVMIGSHWLDIQDSNQNRRLNDPNDFVRIEVESAIKQGNILVIPVLVQGAAMPPAADLPESLHSLAYLNAAIVRNDPDFNRDMVRLIARMRKIKTRQTTGYRGWLLPIGVAVLLAVLALLFFANNLRQTLIVGSTVSPLSTETAQAALPTDRPTDTLTSSPPSETPRLTDTPAISAPQVQPKGRIRYLIPREIVTSTVDGTVVTRTILSLNVANARWSPDGKRIGLVTWEGGLYVMNSNGTNIVLLADHISQNYIGIPVWSLDGQQIAFSSDVHDPPEPDPNLEIYVINADGSNLRRVTNMEGQDWPEYWTQDGKIVYIRYDDTQNHYSIDPDGTNQTVLANYGVDGFVFPSPDGKTVAATLYDFTSQTSEIYTMDIDGSNLRRLTENTVNDGIVSWSPDGQYLLFVSGTDKPDYYTMKVDGSDVHRITNTGNVIAGAWLP